jgi:hypothetical protein
MPRRDGTGPMGRGSMSGKGLGVCSGINARSLNRGNGCRGNSRSFIENETVAKNREELLTEEKELLEIRLDIIKKQLEIK